MIDLTSAESGQACRVSTFTDNGSIRLSFNVLPNRSVEEVFYNTSYRATENQVVATFDRTYRSEMEASPSHVIFLSALIQFQKLCYLHVCHRFGWPYDAGEPERAKVWPTDVTCSMPAMVTSEENIHQTFTVSRARYISPKRLHLWANSDVDGIIRLTGQAMIFIL
jgi:hypothetical protein